MGLRMVRRRTLWHLTLAASAMNSLLAFLTIRLRPAVDPIAAVFPGLRGLRGPPAVARIRRLGSATSSAAPALAPASWDDSDSDIVSWLTGAPGETFFTDTFGRKCLFSPAGLDSGRIGFDEQALLDLLRGISPDNFKNAAMSRTVDGQNEQTTDPLQIRAFLQDQGLVSARDFARLADGWTFVLNLGQGSGSRMRALSHALWARFGLPGGVNAYLTPPGKQGFDVHTDPHDVFVLQEAGTKIWSLFEDGPGGKPTEVLLQTGDVLYIPAGVPHCARSFEDVSSLHLAISVYRGFFSTSGLLAAWLQLGGPGQDNRITFDKLSQEVASRITACHERLRQLAPGHLEPASQLPGAGRALCTQLLRALDASDLPAGAAGSAAEELAQVAEELAKRLPENSALAKDLRACVTAPSSSGEMWRSRRFLETFFAAREYQWLKYYINFEPKELSEDPVDVESLSPGTLFRRGRDVSAVCSASGGLLINGYCIPELPAQLLPALRYCLGVHTGAAGRAFQLQNIPGSESDASEAVSLLLELNGLEQVPKATEGA